MKALFVFLAYVVLDIVWVVYIPAVSHGRARLAGISNGALIALSGYATITYVDSNIMLASAVLGGMAGTFIAVRYRISDRINRWM